MTLLRPAAAPTAAHEETATPDRVTPGYPTLAASGPIDAGGGVQVWSVPLGPDPEHEGALAALLSEDEHQRAARFRFAHLRRRFVICRGSLRLLVGAWVETSPRRVQFEYGPYGKPALLNHAGDVSFNVSHAADRALIAIGRRRHIGIDIEQIKPIANLASLAATVFSPAEQQALASLEPGDRLAGFFNGWTRKEAFIKALGTGITCALDTFDVSLASGAPAQLLRVEGDPDASSHWALRSLPTDAGYVAAICYEQPGRFTMRLSH